ncbi:MAG: hypothetical protein ACRC41_01915 [Sarcina sp.]
MKYKLFTIGGILITVLTGIFLYSFINEYKFDKLYEGKNMLKNDNLMKNKNKIIDRQEAIDEAQTLIEKYFHVNLNDGYVLNVILNNSLEDINGSQFIWGISWQKPGELNPNYYFSINMVGGSINGLGANYGPKIYKNSNHILFNFNVAKKVIEPMLLDFGINMTPENSRVSLVRDGVYEVQIMENGYVYTLFANYYTNQILSYNKTKEFS